MKNIFLTVVIVCALAVAGVGGTLAGWSDTEESQGNYIVTGALDLKVAGEDDLPWGAGIPTLVTLYDVVPSQYYKVTFLVENEGQATSALGSSMSAPLYIELKDFACSNVNPEHDGYTWPPGFATKKPEPELVSEFGGVLGQVNIIGETMVLMGHWFDGMEGFDPTLPSVDQMGITGDVGCSTSTIMELTIYFGEFGGTETEVWSGMMRDIKDVQQYVGELPESGADYQITLEFHMINVEDPNWPGDDKFAGWKTNAWMKDRIDFNIMIELLDYTSGARPD